MINQADNPLFDQEISAEDAVSEVSRITGKGDEEIKLRIPQLALSGATTKLAYEHLGDKGWLFVTVTDSEGLSRCSGIRLSSGSIVDFYMHFPAGTSELKDMERLATLSDLEMVGPNKPLGYGSTKYLLNEGIDLEEYRSQLEQRGLKTVVIPVDGSNGVENWTDEVLYVYDEKTLIALLAKNKLILEKEGWPTDPVGFTKHLGNHTAKRETDLFDLIADAFGDFNNSGRKSMGKSARADLPL